MASDLFADGTGKRFKIRIDTAITDLSSSASDEEIFALMLCREVLGDEAADKVSCGLGKAEKEKYCYRTFAELWSDGEQFRISYRESGDVGLDGCTTILHFCRSEPERLRMMRTGGMHASMHFDTSQKVVQCTYGFPPDSMSFGVFTRKLSCCINENGGSIEVDYIIIFNGKSMERNELRITLSEAEP